MKSKFMRILALILVISSMLSMFSIFAGAEETGTGESGETEENPLDLMYNRTYDEGWDVKNGLSIQGGSNTKFEIDHNLDIRGRYNYFWRMTIGTTANEYLQLVGANKSNKLGSVIEFDFMTDDITSLYNPVVIHTKGASASDVTSLNLMKIVDNKVHLLDSSTPAFTMESEKWYRMQIIMDYTEASKVDDTNTETFKFSLYYGPADGSAPMQLYSGAPMSMTAKSGNGLRLVRFQSTGGDANNIGNSLCFDNLKYYEGANQITPITPDMGYGKNISATYPVTEEIKGSASVSESQDDISAALSMKVGVNYCYFNKAKAPIFEAEDGTAYGAPVKIDGKVMVPLLLVLDYIGFRAQVNPDGIYLTVPTGTTPSVRLIIGKSVAQMGTEEISLSAAPAYAKTAEGYEYIVIALDDIEKLFTGYYSDYDEMGYMVVSKFPDMLNREDNLGTMITIMKKFVFDYYSEEDIYNDVKEHTNFEHPYLLANADQLQMVYDEYHALEEKAALGLIEEYSEEFWMLRTYKSVISNGEWAYSEYARLDANGTYETYNGLLSDEEYPNEHNGKARSTSRTLAQPNMATGGYDFGGRSNPDGRTALLEYMAQAYVLTKDTKYLQVAYEVALVLGQWEHWGPGHFLNCADSSNDFAIYYDWTYQGYLELAASGVKRADGSEYDVAVLAEILARQGVHEGFLSTNGNCDHISDPVGLGGSSYSSRTNNWAAVCVGGMTIASLAILDGHAGEEYVSEAKFILSANFKSLLDLGMDIYAPDGAYVEGPGYWNYGTNNYFRMCAALDTATGGNYGLMDCWGIDTTCYYACHTEDNNSQYFPFHDGSVGSQDTSYFFYVADYFNDATLYDVRLNQINGGTKTGNILDMIYYPRNVEVESNEIQLDYYSESIDLFATRSSWEKDAVFASIIGGKNKVSHGQMDAGDFVYHAAGNIWIYDLGTENYNCTGFWPDATRYRFYVMKPEGNNTVAIASDPTGTPYGQILEGVAQATAWGSNEYGSYVTYDMGGCLGSQTSKWNRGMLLTNDRKTTVIQDQISFQSMQQVYWFAHYNVNIVDGGVEISSDGRTAYMRDYIGTDEHGARQYKTLRLSIVSSNKSFKFQLMTTYQFIHTTGPEKTYTPDEIIALGGEAEKSRSQYRKLAIASGDVLNFDVAVVIELVDEETIGKKTEIEVGYDFQLMSTWTPKADERGIKIDNGDTVAKRGNPNIEVHFVQSMDRIKAADKEGVLYTDELKYYFRYLTDAHYVVNMMGSDMPTEYKSDVNLFKTYRQAYTEFRKAVTAIQNDQVLLAQRLMGMFGE